MQLRDLQIGARVVVQGNKRGAVRFLGRTKFAKDEWVGVELDTVAGKHDGMVEGFRYFQCARPNTGLFIRASDVELEAEADAPPADGATLSSPHRLAASKIQSAFRGHRSRRGSGADGLDEQPEPPLSPSEARDTLASPKSPRSGGTSPRPRHTRNSSDLARTELEALLRRSSYLKSKPDVMKNLTKLIARRPSTVEMMRSGILSNARGAPSPAATADGKSGARLGWAASAPAGSDIEASARRMFVFGENTHGELSTGDEIDRFSPTEMTLPPVKGKAQQPTGLSDFAQVCLGLNHMVVLTLANEVLTCGSWVANLLGTDDRQNLHKLKRLRQFEDLRRKNPGNPIISIGCGDRHTVALHNDGSCESFGGTLYGKLGHRSSGASDNDALPSSSYLSILALQGQKVTQMSAGNWHTVCATTSGSVYTFGGGGKFYNQGQLGHGDNMDSMTPRRIEMFGALPAAKVFVKSIVCGGYHTLALTVDRLVYSWGAGALGQLGLGSDKNHTVPQLVSSLLVRGSGAGRTIGLAAGENHSMCVQADGSVYSWGYGQQGQCGHGHSSNEKLPRKILFFSKRNIIIVQVDAGWRHSIALGENHSVYTWGHGDHGQLGLGDTKSHATPQLVESLEGLEIKTVAAGGSHSLAFNDYFKAAQELVFMQRVREFRQVQSSKIPTLRGASLDTAGGASGAPAQSDAPLLSPKKSGVNPHSLPSPNALVPLGLKSMLREFADDGPASPVRRSSLASPTAVRTPRRASVQFEDEPNENEERGSRDFGGDDGLTIETDEDDDALNQQANDAVEQLNEAYSSLSAPSPALEQQPYGEYGRSPDEDDYDDDGKATNDQGDDDEGDHDRFARSLDAITDADESKYDPRDARQYYDDDGGSPRRQQPQSYQSQPFLPSEYSNGYPPGTAVQQMTTMHSTTRTTYTSHSSAGTHQTTTTLRATSPDDTMRQAASPRSESSARGSPRDDITRGSPRTDISRGSPRNDVTLLASPSSAATPRADVTMRASSAQQLHSSLSSNATLDSLSIELVYSEQVHCTHRFITFQTNTDESIVRRMVDSYKRTPYGSQDVLLDQLMVTPANTVSRASRLERSIGGSSTARDEHIYEYDSVGPPRYTVLLILGTVSSDEDLWPDWASTFYYSLTRTCKDITVSAGLQHSHQVRDFTDDQALRPCFRELRPPTARRTQYA